MGSAVSMSLAPNTNKRARARSKARQEVQQQQQTMETMMLAMMSKFDHSNTGALNEAEVRSLCLVACTTKL